MYLLARRLGSLRRRRGRTVSGSWHTMRALPGRSVPVRRRC